MKNFKSGHHRIKKLHSPKELKKQIIEAEDRLFVIIFFVAFSLHLFFIISVKTKEIKESATINLPVLSDINPRFARLIYEPAPVLEKNPEVKNKIPDADRLTPNEKKKEGLVEAEGKKSVEAPERAESSAVESPRELINKKPAPIITEEMRRAKVKTKGLLAILVGKKPGGSKKNKEEGSMPNLITDKKVVKNLETVFNKLDELTIQSPSRTEKAKNTDSSLEINNLKSTRTPAMDTIKLEKEKINVEELLKIKGEGLTHPKRSKGIISGVVQAYLPGLKYIFNKELKKNPGLEGKIVVELTILADGSVLNCTILSSTMNSPEFEGEVLKRIKRWSFPPIDSGEVVVHYPFVFYPVITG